MTNRLVRRLCLLAALLFSLCSCATGSLPSTDSAGLDAPRTDGAPVLTIVYCGSTKGNYEPCPT